MMPSDESIPQNERQQCGREPIPLVNPHRGILSPADGGAVVHPNTVPSSRWGVWYDDQREQPELAG
jgi:hypothetical protein